MTDHYFTSLQERVELEARTVLEDTLSERLAGDLADEIAHQVVEMEEMNTSVRYVLINDEGQLESRMLFEAHEEAERAAKTVSNGCLVATLLYESC